jgi:hypothetical protein
MVRRVTEPSDVPVPEPEPVDEDNALTLQRLVDDSTLKAQPYGDQHCRNCLYYLDTDSDFSYCWQPKVRILVDQDWWCQWWEEQEI